VWWREIASIRDGVGSTMGSWFSNNARIIVGNGVGICFG